ncbi:MAG: hypothetical protein PVI26_09565 [Chitinispirillia bacterium]|jgi:hypothetical protein
MRITKAISLALILFVCCSEIFNLEQEFSIIGNWANPTAYLIGQGDPTYDTLNFKSNSSFLWRKTIFNGCPYNSEDEICDGWKSKNSLDSGSYIYQNDSLFLNGKTETTETITVLRTESSKEIILTSQALNAVRFVKF